jgi:cbb3-type cytochrome oxidase subunit 3
VELFAQHSSSGDDGSLVISLIALVAMIVPWFVLAYVSWIFWKARKRAEPEEARLRRMREEERRWRNAHSS